MKILVIVTIIMTIGCSPWTRADTYREVAYLALHVTDYGQTLYISDHPQEYHETNRIMGKHPSRGTVNWYFLATGVLHPVVSFVLPRPYRELWQYGTILSTGYFVINNNYLGIGFGF